MPDQFHCIHSLSIRSSNNKHVYFVQHSIRWLLCFTFTLDKLHSKIECTRILTIYQYNFECWLNCMNCIRFRVSSYKLLVNSSQTAWIRTSSKWTCRPTNHQPSIISLDVSAAHPLANDDRVSASVCVALTQLQRLTTTPVRAPLPHSHILSWHSDRSLTSDQINSRLIFCPSVEQPMKMY